MSALINRAEHAFAAAASDTVKAAKFVETSVLPVLKSAQANSSTIEAISPQAANIERIGFAVLGVVINALDARLVADIKALAAAVKGALPVAAAPAK